IIWARFARVVRGEVLGVRARDFVSLARVHGCSSLRIMMVHIVPNVMNTFMVLLTLHIGFVIIVEASLSFLGARIPPPTPSRAPRPPRPRGARGSGGGPATSGAPGGSP